MGMSDSSATAGSNDVLLPLPFTAAADLLLIIGFGSGFGLTKSSPCLTAHGYAVAHALGLSLLPPCNACTKHHVSNHVLLQPFQHDRHLFMNWDIAHLPPYTLAVLGGKLSCRFAESCCHGNVHPLSPEV